MHIRESVTLERKEQQGSECSKSLGLNLCFTPSHEQANFRTFYSASANQPIGCLVDGFPSRTRTRRLNLTTNPLVSNRCR